MIRSRLQPFKVTGTLLFAAFVAVLVFALSAQPGQSFAADGFLPTAR